jgi:hypothetical protein
MTDTKKYKYLNKEFLNRINHISRDVMKYNRSLPQDLIDRLPEERFYIITFSMLHEHIAGKPADPHVRCLIYGGPDVPNPMILDVEMGLYDTLPEAEVPAEPEPSNSKPEVAAT